MRFSIPLFLWSFTFLATALSAVDRPNIILVMTDDQGYGDLGVHGNDVIETPNLDRFAGESLGMDRFYVNPLCAPTRASLMTGRYYLRTGILHTSRGAAKMFGDEVTIAEILKGAGYRTGIFGKWHLGDNYPMRPQDQGFEEVLVHRSGGIGQTPDGDANYFEPVVWRNGDRIDAKGYCTDLFFDATLDFVRKKDERPFFVYLATNVPHGPLEVSKDYSQPFEAGGTDPNVAKIYGMLKNLDENFGRLIAELDDLGLRENTVVVFMTDNGPTSGRYNAGMRGAKGSVYEGGIRVPFYVRWPGQFEAGKRIDRIAAHIDVLPTMAEIAEAELPKELLLDGKSLLPLWRASITSAAWSKRTLFTQHIKSIIQAPFQNATAFDQRYKIVSYPKAANEARFTANKSQLEIALFDIESDFAETADLSKSKPEVLNELKLNYERWFEEMRQTRDFQPGRIHLGTRFENPSHLCRYQDGHRAYGTDPEPIGWPVRIAERGRYRLVFDVSEFWGSIAVVGWKGETTKMRMASAQRSIILELGEGDGMLDIWFEDLGGKTVSKDFDVTVERLD